MPKIFDEWQVQPHGKLEEIEDGVLTVSGDIKMPLGNFPRRMTVIRLTNNRTAIFSAIALEEPEMEQIEALGLPSVLIIPNAGHRLDSKIWKQRYPAIQVLTPAGAAESVREAVAVDATLDILNDPDCLFITVAGTDEAEAAVIVKRQSGVTLLTNDIIGHVTDPHGIGAKLLTRVLHYGAREPEIPSTIKRYIKDEHALATQLRSWADIPDLKRIVVSHGEPITDKPAAHLRRLADQIDR